MKPVIITIPRSVEIEQNPIDFNLRIKLYSMSALDNIIEQCRDIKLKMMEEEKVNV